MFSNVFKYAIYDFDVITILYKDLVLENNLYYNKHLSEIDFIKHIINNLNDNIQKYFKAKNCDTIILKEMRYLRKLL